LPRLYQNVGPDAIRQRVSRAPSGIRIESAADFITWVEKRMHRPNPDGLLAVTFVVNEQGSMVAADRHSEHIVCSGGQHVLSAGEMFFASVSPSCEVVEVSNQSTGFCLELESWPVVAAALDSACFKHPSVFAWAVTFRRCRACGERNIVKTGWFVCGVCGEELPADWNFGEDG